MHPTLPTALQYTLLQSGPVLCRVQWPAGPQSHQREPWGGRERGGRGNNRETVLLQEGGRRVELPPCPTPGGDTHYCGAAASLGSSPSLTSLYSSCRCSRQSVSTSLCLLCVSDIDCIFLFTLSAASERPHLLLVCVSLYVITGLCDTVCRV